MIYSSELLPILISLMFLSIVVLWVAIRNYKNFLITFIIIPVTFVSVITSYLTLQNLLGFPVVTPIPNDSFYINHIVDGDVIYVWAWPTETEKPRLYSIPNTEQNKKAMDEAAKAQEEGKGQKIGQEGADQDGTGVGKGQTQGGEYNTYDFVVTDPDNLKGN
jgi:hypothetical protein